MKKEYQEIITRIISTMGNSPEWFQPWLTAPEYPDVIHEKTRFDAVLEIYYKREHIGYTESEQPHSYYSPADDSITLPAKKQFRNLEAYCAVKAHETIHSTGDYTRCNRETFNEYKSFRFGDSKYSREELVAEIGACFLLSALGVDTTQAERNASAYINNWLSKLNNNTKWIYKASALAIDAVEYILDITGNVR